MSSLLKKLSISIKIHVIKQLWSLFSQFPNCRPNPSSCRRELVANCVHTADADATKQFRRVGNEYWAFILSSIHFFCFGINFSQMSLLVPPVAHKLWISFNRDCTVSGCVIYCVGISWYLSNSAAPWAVFCSLLSGWETASSRTSSTQPSRLQRRRNNSLDCFQYLWRYLHHGQILCRKRRKFR